MISKIKKIFETQTLRQAAVTSAATFLASGLGAVFYLLLAKILGPAEYGLFFLAMATLAVVTSVADLGLGPSLVRFVGANRQNRQYLPFVNLALKTKFISGLLVTITFAGLSSFLARYVFHQPALSSLLSLVGIGVLSQLLFFLPLAVFQGLQRFWLWGGFQVGVNALRLFLLVPFIIFFHLTTFQSLLVFVAAYIVGFGISLFWMDKGLITSNATNPQIKSFWSFNKWTALTGVLMAAASRVDIFLTGRFLSLAQVGIYSLATIMVAFLPQLAGAIGAVTTAKFASFHDPESPKKYLGKAVLFVGGISVLVALAMIPVAIIVIRFAGKSDYIAAFVPFVILLVGLVIFLFTNPIRDSLMYYHTKPQFFFWLSLGQAITVFLVGWNLIPLWGVMGASLSFVAGQIFVAGTSIWYYRKIAYA